MNPWLTIKSEEGSASRSGGNASLDVSTPLQEHFKLNTAKCMLRARHFSGPPNLQNLFKVKAYDNLLFHRTSIRTQ